MGLICDRDFNEGIANHHSVISEGILHMRSAA